MIQNRNKLIELLIGNLSNFAVHKILEKSINKPELTSKYQKESINSFNISLAYRNKVNPIDKPLSNTDISYIKIKISNRVNSELSFRISKGYENIDLTLINHEIEKVLKELKIF